MKKIYLYFTFLTLTPVILSCNKNVTIMRTDYTFVDTIHFNMDDNSIPYRDGILNNARYVKLETLDNNLIGKIDELYFIDSTIVVVDKDIAKAVFLFVLQGNYKSRVSFLGRGRHEYLQLTHVFLENDTISIHDMYKREINYFDLNGKYIKTENYDFTFNEVEKLANGFLACNIYQGINKEYPSLNDCSFVILDKESNPVYAFGKDNSNPNMFFTRTKNLYSFDGHVYCTVNFENVIYELTSDSVIAKYRLTLFPPYKLEDVTFKSMEQAMDYISQNAFFHGFHLELKDCSLFGIGIPRRGQQYFVYYHKTKETYLIPSESLNPLYSFFSSPMFRCGDNTVVVPVNATRVLDTKQALEQNGIYSFQGDDIESDANPILFFYDFYIKTR